MGRRRISELKKKIIKKTRKKEKKDECVFFQIQDLGDITRKKLVPRNLGLSQSSST